MSNKTKAKIETVKTVAIALSDTRLSGEEVGETIKAQVQQLHG